MPSDRHTIFVVALLSFFLAIRYGECEVVPVFEKASSDVRLKLVYGQVPSVATKVSIDRLSPRSETVLESFARRSDSRGCVRLKDLKMGGLYRIYISGEQGEELVSLYLRIDAGRQGISEFTLEVPEQPHVQPLSSLEGKVFDVTGAGIPNVELEVALAGGEPRQFLGRTKTGPRGEYSFQVPDGQYNVRFTAPGFYDVRVMVVVTSDDRDDAWRGLRLTMNVAGEGRYKPYNYSVAEDK